MKQQCNNNNAEITPFIPVLAGWNLHMSQTLSHQRRDVWPINCTPKDAHASVFFFYTSGTPHARHICTHFELWGRPFCWLLLASFFLPFGVAMKGIQSLQLRCHISFLSFVWLTTCFLSSQEQLLNSHKHQLFCLHIQHATRCLSLNDKPQLAYQRQQSVGSAFQFTTTTLLHPPYSPELQPYLRLNFTFIWKLVAS